MGREVLCEVTADYMPDRGPVDLRRLREAVADLMDRAAHAVEVAGLQQDEAVLERWMTCRYAGDDRSLTVPIESLTDREWLMSAFHKAAAAAFSGPGDGEAGARQVEIIGLKVIAVTDPVAPIGNDSGW